MKALLLLPLVALMSITVNAASKSCVASNKKMGSLIDQQAALKARAILILQDLKNINISPREAKARLDVDFQAIIALDDKINTIEKTCNGRYDLWTVEGDIKDAVKAAQDEVKQLK